MQREDINTATGNATKLANTAKTEAIASANAHTDEETKNYFSRRYC